MASDHYIADASNTNKVYLDYEPTPTPFPKPSRKVGIQNTVPGISAAGRVRVVDMGAGGAHKTIEIYCPDITYANYVLIETKYTSQPTQVIYSPDNGTTLITCSWEGDNSLEPIPDRGANPWTSTFALRMRLRVHSIEIIEEEEE